MTAKEAQKSIEELLEPTAREAMRPETPEEEQQRILIEKNLITTEDF